MFSTELRETTCPNIKLSPYFYIFKLKLDIFFISQCQLYFSLMPVALIPIFSSDSPYLIFSRPWQSSVVKPVGTVLNKRQ